MYSSLSEMALTKIDLRKFYGIANLSAALLLAACVTIDIDVPANHFCESPDLLVDRNFEGGNFHNCSLTDDGDFSRHIRRRE